MRFRGPLDLLDFDQGLVKKTACRVSPLERLILGVLGPEHHPVADHVRVVANGQHLELVLAGASATAPAIANCISISIVCSFSCICLPERVTLTRDDGGEHDERSVFEQHIERDHCYVLDRGYAKFTLFNRVHAKRSSYVCRLRDNSAMDVIEDRGRMANPPVEARVNWKVRLLKAPSGGARRTLRSSHTIL